MVELKIVIADQKEGRSYQKVITEDDSKNLYGKKIKDTFNGEMIDGDIGHSICELYWF